MGKNPLPISPFTYISLKIKFVPFLKSSPATIPCKRKMIKVATKLLIKKRAKEKRERERKIEIDSPKRNPNFGFCACVKTKKGLFRITSD